jgi:hypothetical protein
MHRHYKFNIAAILFLFALSAAPLFGQATFSLSAASTTGTAIGATELTGSVTLSIVSGSSAQSPFAIQYSAPITNNSENEIVMSGTGLLVGVALHPSLDTSSNSIVLSVPSGGVPGATITITGVRVALAGQNITSVTASVSSPTSSGNAIIGGQGAVTVIHNIVNVPFAVDETSSPALLWQNGQVVTGTTSIVISEKYAGAFSSIPAPPTYGQTVPTRFQIKLYRPLPAGVTLTFPATATSQEGTGATLTAISALTLSRDTNSSVTYSFSAVAASPTTMESFSITVSASLDTGSTSSGTVAFQVTLLPVGIAVPNSDFPSTDIPRYSQLTLPADSDIVIAGFVDLAFPFRAQNAGTYTGIAMTNLQDYPVNVTLSAYDTTGALVFGTNISNPVTLSIPANGQTAKLATEIFGAGFNATTAGTIRARGNTSILPGFYLIGDTSGSRLDGATAEISTLVAWTWPIVFHQSPSPSTLLELYNPGTTTANATLKLFNSAGVALSTASVQVSPNGTLASDVTSVFSGLDVNSFTGGYITAQSDTPLIPRETFGNARDNNVLFAQNGVQRSTIQIAHFASGGGYTTEINILNADPRALGQITLTALDNNGTALAIAGNPKSLSIQPGNQLIQTMQDMFPALGPTLTTGYIQLDVVPSNLGPFATSPPILGSIRFSSADGFASAALPLFLPASADFVYSHVAQNLGYFTGVALLNTNTTTAATVTLEVRDKAGTLVGSYTTTLQPGQKIAKLLYEMVPGSQGQVGGYIHINSNVAINSFALFGTNDGKSLSAIPPQRSN